MKVTIIIDSRGRNNQYTKLQYYLCTNSNHATALSHSWVGCLPSVLFSLRQADLVLTIPSHSACPGRLLSPAAVRARLLAVVGVSPFLYPFLGRPWAPRLLKMAPAWLLGKVKIWMVAMVETIKCRTFLQNRAKKTPGNFKIFLGQLREKFDGRGRFVNYRKRWLLLSGREGVVSE